MGVIHRSYPPLLVIHQNVNKFFDCGKHNSRDFLLLHILSIRGVENKILYVRHLVKLSFGMWITVMRIDFVK